MEEKNKTIKMSIKDKENENKPQKYTYDQLNDICNQLFQQNQELVKQIQQLNQAYAFKRLEFLFKVLELSSVIKDTEFITACVEEVKEAMTPIQEDNSKDN